VTSETLLEAEDLGKIHQVPGGLPVVAVAGVHLVLRERELVVLAGPSGSGKSTLLGLLTGLEAPTSGRVHGAAAGVAPWSVQAIVPQSLGLLEELTLEENVRLPLRLARRNEEPGRINQLLDRLGLGDARARRPGATSLGEQQRAAIARALVLRPRLVVLDEPTAHQDARSRDRVIQELGRAAFEGAAVLAATHDPAVRAVADRCLWMAGGHLREEPEADWSPPSRAMGGLAAEGWAPPGDGVAAGGR
jgi:putative ABC transport system ATP-binding protein